jgi:hypothetical protein
MWEAVLPQRQAVGSLSTHPLPKEGCVYMCGRQKVNRVLGCGQNIGVSSTDQAGSLILLCFGRVGLVSYFLPKVRLFFCYEYAAIGGNS